MKILIANEYFTESGGTEQYLMPLKTELEKLGHVVSVVYGAKMGNEVSTDPPGRYYVENSFSFRSGNRQSMLDMLKEIIKTEDPDLLFINEVHNPYAVQTLVESRPSVRFFHGYKISCPSGMRTLHTSDRICEDPLSLKCAYRAYSERCLPRNPLEMAKLFKIGFGNIKVNQQIKRIIVASTYMKDMLIHNGFKQDGITVLPYYTETPSSNDSKTIHGTPVIFCAGRMVPGKGIAELLEALSFIKTDWECIVAGTGTSLEYFKEVAARFGLTKRVHFIGWVSNNSLGEYYRKASVVVVPSYWPEPFGIVGIEAMSYALPVVAFNVGGISEWLTPEKTGFLVKRKDIRSLSEKIELLINNKDLRERMGLEAKKEFLRRFTKETHLNQLTRIFEQAVKERV